MPYKIAIITGDYEYNYNLDENQLLIDTITDWTEVSDEDYTLLRAAQQHYNFKILEFPDQSRFIRSTVEDWKKHIAEQNRKHDLHLAEIEKAKEEKVTKQKMKQQAKRRKIFEELSKEFKNV